MARRTTRLAMLQPIKAGPRDVTIGCSVDQVPVATPVDTQHEKAENPEIAPRVRCFAPAGIASVWSKTKPYFASFSISFSTMLVGTSS